MPCWGEGGVEEEEEDSTEGVVGDESAGGENGSGHWSPFPPLCP